MLALMGVGSCTAQNPAFNLRGGESSSSTRSESGATSSGRADPEGSGDRGASGTGADSGDRTAASDESTESSAEGDETRESESETSEQSSTSGDLEDTETDASSEATETTTESETSTTDSGATTTSSTTSDDSGLSTGENSSESATDEVGDSGLDDPISCELESSMASGTGDNDLTVSFYNSGFAPRVMFVLDKEGTRMAQDFLLYPGGRTSDWPTKTGDVWIIADQFGDCKAIYRIGLESGTVDFSD